MIPTPTADRGRPESSARPLTMQERIGASALILLSLLLPTAAEWAQALGRRSMVAGGVLILLIAWSWMCSGPRGSSRLLRATGVLYALPAAACFGTVLVFTSQALPALYAGLIAWILPAAVLYIRKKSRAAWAWHLACLVLTVAVLSSHLPGSGVLIVGTAAYAVFIAATAIRRGGRRLGPLLFVVHIVAILTYVCAYTFNQGWSSDADAPIDASPAARVVMPFDYARTDVRYLGSSFMFAAPIPGGLILGPQNPNRTLGVLGGKEPERIYLGYRVGDDVAYENWDPPVIYCGAEDRVLRLRTNPVAVEATWPVPGGVVNFVRLDRSAQRIFFSRDNGRTVGRLNLEDGSVVETERGSWWELIYGVAFDEGRRRFYASVFSPAGWRIREGDADTMAWLREVQIPRAFGFFIESDPGRGLLYAPSYQTGEIVVISADTMTIARRRRVGAGIRCVEVDPTRPRVYASDPVNGELIAYDEDRDAVAARIRVGRTGRQPTAAPDGSRLALRTSAGIVEIDLNMVDAAPAAEPPPPDGPTPGGVIRSWMLRAFLPVDIALRGE